MSDPFSGGTIAGNILPDADGRDLGSTTQRWDVFAQAFDAETSGAIRNAASFDGADMGAKILAAYGDLPASGGIVDARGFEGNQSISSDILSGMTHQVVILLGHATITTVKQTFPGGTVSGSFRMQLIGAGIGQTVLIPAAINQIVLAGPSGAYPADGYTVSGLTIKANAGGSTGTAIDLSGFRYSTFEDIEYKSNGGNFASFFHFAASPQGCYGNVIRRGVVSAQTGPTTVFLFDNGGTANSLYNANENYIYDSWIYNNTGITTVFDARRSALTKISGGLVESNTGAVVLIPGTNTTFENVWLESNAAVPIVPTTGADGASNGVHFLRNHISTAFTLTLPNTMSGWEIDGNWPDANLTVVDASGTNTIARSGRTFKTGANAGGLLLKNTSAAGAAYDLQVTGSGDSKGTGFFILDSSASQARASFLGTGLNFLTAGASNQSTLLLRPLDDANTSTKIFNVTLADAVTSAAYITKPGDAMFASANLGASSGGLATQRANVALVNGANANIGITGSLIKINGPTGVFSISGFTGGQDGRQLKVFNSAAFAMTITNEGVGSTNVNRITTLTGADVVLRAGTSFATFIYDSVTSRWILESTN